MKLLITGGGTAGHINPGIAIAREIISRYPEVEILFVGTNKGLEKDLVPREGFNISFIKAKGLKGKITFHNLKAAMAMIIGMIQSWRIITKFRPDVAIGTGGYVCFPILFIAAKRRIPILLHEQNAFPGKTNKMLAKYTKKIMISFESSKKYFTSKNTMLTGNPVRKGLLNLDKDKAREKLGIRKDLKFVIIMGGSGGAEAINDATVEFIMNNYNSNDFRLLFSTGKRDNNRIMDKMTGKIPEGVNIVPYIYNVEDVYAACDLIINRAGAITATELLVMGKPGILIPSPHVANNHQEYNARELENEGAVKVVIESELSGLVLYNNIMELLSDEIKLKEMERNCKKMAKTDAVKEIADIIETYF